MKRPKKAKGSCWLFIHPFVYLSIKKNHAILYNTLNGRLLEYENDAEILQLIKRLDSARNLYVVKLANQHINPKIKKFITQIREKFMGDVVDTAFSSTKPIQTKPLLGLQRSLEESTTTASHNKLLSRDEIREYLNTITLYVNSQCKRNCTLCQGAYRQLLLCCKNSIGNKEIYLKDIENLLRETEQSKLVKLNILGGDIFKYSKFPELVDLLNHISIKKEYFIHYLNLRGQANYLKLFENDTSRVNVLIHFPVEPGIFEDIVRQIEVGKAHHSFHFIIQSDSDMETTEAFISKYQLEDVKVTPYFNGGNIAFFKRSVFLTKESILESRPTMHDILARTAINTLSFKKITILSDGAIYANVNNPRIGNLKKDYIFDLLDRELNRGKSWSRIRKHVMPCKSCVFHALCPPLSGYEYVMKRNNLCHIRVPAARQ
jgi:pseudo-rSAM protein